MKRVYDPENDQTNAGQFVDVHTLLPSSNTLDKRAAEKFRVAADFSVLGWFLLLGVLSGFLFASLISASSLESFFFVKGDKFLNPRYSYWWALSLTQLIGLGGAYAGCIARRLVGQRISHVRLVAAALIIALATPVLRLLTPLMNSRIGLDWDFVAAPLAFLFLLSCALCVVSGNLKWLPLAIVWNLFFTAIGVGVIYLCVRIVGPGEYYAFVQWPVLFATLGLSFGSWLIWRRLWNSKRAAYA